MQGLTKERDDALENVTKLQEENRVLKTQVSTYNVNPHAGMGICACF